MEGLWNTGEGGAKEQNGAQYGLDPMGEFRESALSFLRDYENNPRFIVAVTPAGSRPRWRWRKLFRPGGCGGRVRQEPRSAV